jgi:hypothetical protein
LYCCVMLLCANEQKFLTMNCLKIV